MAASVDPKRLPLEGALSANVIRVLENDRISANTTGHHCDCSSSGVGQGTECQKAGCACALRAEEGKGTNSEGRAENGGASNNGNVKGECVRRGCPCAKQGHISQSSIPGADQNGVGKMITDDRVKTEQEDMRVKDTGQKEEERGERLAGSKISDKAFTPSNPGTTVYDRYYSFGQKVATGRDNTIRSV